MLEVITVLCLIGALILLCALSIVDLREGLLPNELVMGFTTLGLGFNLSTLFGYADFQEMALGALIGGGLLYTIRGVANAIYKDDTLGLGDVKLIGAAGVWLGAEFILIALTIGALAGFLHGIGLALYTRVKSKVHMNLSTLSIPAGPGFAVGIIIAGVIKFRDLPLGLWP